MKKTIALILVMLLALSTLTVAMAAQKIDKATVKAVQQALNDAGYECGKPDGSAGKKTKSAVSQYQADHGMEATGEIDDALLEALGLGASESDDTEMAEAPAEPEQAADSTAPAEADLNDPQAFGTAYNECFLARLKELGVDVDHEDIGQQAYLMKSVYKESFGFSLSAENVNIAVDTEDSMLWLAGSNKRPLEELTFLDHAALYAFYTVTNAYYGGTEDDLSTVLASLGDAPERDGTVVFVDEFDYGETSSYSYYQSARGYDGNQTLWSYSAESN